MERSRFFLSNVVSALLFASSAFTFATTCWHIPDNSGDLGVHMRDPWIEISNNPASPTTITIYQGIQKWTNSGGTQIANQNGGTLYFKGASQQIWSSVALGFFVNHQSQNNQYWSAQFSTTTIAANDPIQYYIFVSTDGSNGNGSGFLYAPSGLGDHGGAFITGSDSTGDPGKATAATSPFTIRNRPGWIFHANNRVNSGSDIQFWAKVGYIGDPNSLTTRWATNGTLYYTTDGSEPVPSANPGTSGSAATQIATFTYDHPENNSQNGGSSSIAGTAMWWVATAPNLLNSALGTTVKYKVGFWNPSNNEQKFGDYNAGDGGTYTGHTFSFSIGTIGDPVLTVNGVNGNYTTTHVFIDETKGDSSLFTILFSPGQANLTAVELFTNLNRRDKVTTPYTDANNIATEEGIEPLNGDLITAGDDSHYYKTYTMTPTGNPGEYSYSLGANKTGAYRLTARWKVQGDPNWRYYTNIGAGRRDHAIVVSPVTARNINLYEANVFNLDADGTAFSQRGTLEDMYDAGNAPHQGSANHWNLNYLKSLGCNWLWFQPVHPITEEAQLGHNPGSPYSVRNFFDINPYMTTLYNSGAGPNDTTNRDNARLAFAGLVSAANNAGVGIMLDAPFNHSAPDCEISSQGTSLFGNNPSAAAFFRDVEARFYSRSGNYAMRGSGSGNIAIAPDRGDFGKWSDVRDVYFGRYAALVDINPDDNGYYLNEQDWFDYSIGSDSSSGSGNGHFDVVTQNVWRYFSNYTLFWLSQTGVPPGTDLATQTTKGIGALRADFGQGLPPQLWEYIINKTRTRKWNFLFMAESLDGGAVTYRSNRHFDILNENIVFPLKSANNASDYRNIFESRRSAYGQSLVLMNNMSHDEEAFADPWQAVVRYAVCGSLDGVPLIFPGQELGISTTFGYSLYEVNFGKNIADFKDFNSMVPAWNDANYGNDQLYPVYQGIGKARLSSPALRSANRYFLNEDTNNTTIFAVAKYETKNASPATSDVVFAFANTNRDASPSGNFHVNQDTDNDGTNDYGIKPTRSYNIKSIAAYIGVHGNRRDIWQWRVDPNDPLSAPAPKTGSDVLNNGILVLMNKVPTTDGDWATAPYEAQYLKLYDVTAPSTTPGTAAGPNVFGYVIGNSLTLNWTAAPADGEGVVPSYRVGVTINGNTTYYFTSNPTLTLGVTTGQTLSITVQAVNPNDTSVTGPTSAPAQIKALDANADDDGDGMSNGKEDFAGTNPLDAKSLLAVSSVARPDATHFSVIWNSVTGKSYQAEVANAPGGTYNPVGSSVTATGSSSSTTVAGTPPAFYHVRVLP